MTDSLQSVEDEALFSGAGGVNESKLVRGNLCEPSLLVGQARFAIIRQAEELILMSDTRILFGEDRSQLALVLLWFKARHLWSESDLASQKTLFSIC